MKVLTCGTHALLDMTGGFLATLGMLLSSFATRLEHLYVTYGLILGIGASLAYAPSLVILGHYFDKRLGLANGIVTAGSSTFTMIMPLILDESLKHFGIPTTFVFLTFLMSTLMLCALTFRERPVPPASSSGCEEIAKQKISCSSTSSNSLNNLSTRTDEHQSSQNFINRSIWSNKLYLLWITAIPTG